MCLGFDDITGEALSQREDDKPEVVKKRLDTYEAMTKPLLDYYRGIGNGSPSNSPCTVQVFSGTESNVIYPEIKSFLLHYLNQK